MTGLLPCLLLQLFPSKLEALWRRIGKKVEGREHSLPNAGRCVVLVSGMSSREGKLGGCSMGNSHVDP